MRDRRVHRDVAGHFFVSPGRGACGADAGTVNAPQLPVDVSIVIELHLQRFEDVGKDAALAPLAEVVVHRLPGTISIRQITPGGAGAENPEDAVEHEAWITRRPAGACCT